VTPKAKDEEEMLVIQFVMLRTVAIDGLLTTIRFRRNQCTPLLRLPAELRAAIWDHALGGQVFKLKHSPFAASEWDAKLVPSNAEPMKSIALLRTCRQIYSETVSCPLAHGVIEYGYPWLLVSSRSALRPHERDYVQRIRISTPNLDPPNWWDEPDGYCGSWNWKNVIGSHTFSWMLSEFPRVREVEILFHDVVDAEGEIFQSRAKENYDWIGTNYSFKRSLFFKVRGTSEKFESFEIESLSP
jgi:hypothetical protein